VKLVVGLGNPGPGYASTRHNIGFRVVEALARRAGVGLQAERFAGRFGSGRVGPLGVAVLEPQTFMNRSGDCVAAALDELEGVDPGRDLVVVYDDLDLPLERIRLRARGGCGGHRGMQSIAAELDREDFARLRFGIGRPPPGVDVIDYVLSPFGDQAEPSVASAVERSVEAILAALTGGMESAMERFNRAPEGEG
jgi:PTH1 family peptidyl-tRNA hydrolase